MAKSDEPSSSSSPQRKTISPEKPVETGKKNGGHELSDDELSKVSGGSGLPTGKRT
jgi:bacteriocin-like protein